ncbi:unnamed protein product [Rotaria sp. Silwood1]|nr:unnamed protein product [Rotaria sp. Silwood1]CAF3851921.1 unnamed protein product [Rotaria sp. Silwood1]CAF3935865.1 unnamed protein product [Rotaria sp. Silwood1]CAF4967397.1 unnamed protein product [Rotaria sp. Silwood1]CAF5023248.1 unnamed protein product [Rotaria sp. Silwood1]
MSAQGNLSQNCWTAMVCLNKIFDHAVRMSCEQYFESSHSNAHLYNCESFTQFPIIPILQGHVRFLYRPKNILNKDFKLALISDYVCYDEQLCKFLKPTFRNGNDTCRHNHEMGLDPNITYHNWKSMIDSIKP